MENNTIDFTGYVQHLSSDAKLDFRLPVVLKIIVTSKEKESKKVSDFISDTSRIENFRIQIIKNDE